MLTATRPDDPRDDRLNTVGRPFLKSTAASSTCHRAVVAIGQPGEICAADIRPSSNTCTTRRHRRTIDRRRLRPHRRSRPMDERGYVTITGGSKN